MTALLAWVPLVLGAVLAFLTEGTTGRALKRVERMTAVRLSYPSGTQGLGELDKAIQADLKLLNSLSVRRTKVREQGAWIVLAVLIAIAFGVLLWYEKTLWLDTTYLTSGFVLAVGVFLATMAGGVVAVYLSLQQVLR